MCKTFVRKMVCKYASAMISIQVSFLQSNFLHAFHVLTMDTCQTTDNIAIEYYISVHFINSVICFESHMTSQKRIILFQ